MDKVYISNKISPEIAELYDRMAEELGPPKNRIIEAAFEAFDALPNELKYILKSNNQKDRQLCLKVIRALRLPIESAESDKDEKSSKSG